MQDVAVDLGAELWERIEPSLLAPASRTWSRQ